MDWIVETLNDTVNAELAELPPDMRARFIRTAQLIQSAGLPHIGEQGPLWEIRLTGKAEIAGALYVTAKPRRIIVVRVFVKKTQKTPSREITLALQRAKELDT